ncbi:aspartate transcarbamoylase [Theileria orientalis strain Shintoku]|uniref:aspartate carbamoyltransferase n=1 Tax=Theileria orientalis strain Shintoku TaxID=869250 RepID=J4CC85_THEOR|nr:aspartate transcarbamoylase [Theileria orientalis strain Shintoku]PVC53172.1 aspartate transcarbamoylase [Theileria orientalis]BAM38952.1 aspartate transcarbamoylase [Theileria orientalis strain Shintoku]|eukprot:XP_009689253.1 aspartate transcarbamoylase [Theileria orientalis strain Shintoku]
MSKYLRDPWVALGAGTATVTALYALSCVPWVRKRLNEFGLCGEDPLYDYLDSLSRKVALTLHNKSLIGVDDLSVPQIQCIFEMAEFFRIQMKRNRRFKFLADKVMTTLFYEPSTRTRCSFESAMLKLGGKVVSVSDVTSSSVKGETLEDSVRVLSSYCDLVVVRHPENNSLQRVRHHSLVPLINAGDGSGEHPTQALLDVYTLSMYFPLFGSPDKEFTVCLMGDLKYARTTHSLVRLLSRFNVVLKYVAVPSLQMPTQIQREVEQNFAKYNIPDLAYPRQTSFNKLLDALENVDAIYVTRVQRERMTDAEYKTAKDAYKLDKSVMSKLAKHVKILHPLPRVDEISTEIDSDERCVFFQQAKNGLYIRMALLYLILNGS